MRSKGGEIGECTEEKKVCGFLHLYFIFHIRGPNIIIERLSVE